jgi:hypothetical protein
LGEDLGRQFALALVGQGGGEGAGQADFVAGLEMGGQVCEAAGGGVEFDGETGYRADRGIEHKGIAAKKRKNPSAAGRNQNDDGGAERPE